MRTRLPKLGVKGVPFFNKSYKRGTFSAKMVYKRVRGWTSGHSLPTLKYPPPPPPRAGANPVMASIASKLEED